VNELPNGAAVDLESFCCLGFCEEHGGPPSSLNSIKQPLQYLIVRDGQSQIDDDFVLGRDFRKVHRQAKFANPCGKHGEIITIGSGLAHGFSVRENPKTDRFSRRFSKRDETGVQPTQRSNVMRVLMQQGEPERETLLGNASDGARHQSFSI
jgi:hypothetical protein